MSTKPQRPNGFLLSHAPVLGVHLVLLTGLVWDSLQNTALRDRGMRFLLVGLSAPAGYLLAAGMVHLAFSVGRLGGFIRFGLGLVSIAWLLMLCLLEGLT